jgi:hypothetical protein
VWLQPANVPLTLTAAAAEGAGEGADLVLFRAHANAAMPQ